MLCRCRPPECGQRLFIPSFLYSKEVSHHHLYSAESQNQAGEWGSFIVR